MVVQADASANEVAAEAAVDRKAALRMMANGAMRASLRERRAESGGWNVSE
jgi:hypothetical protein